MRSSIVILWMFATSLTIAAMSDYEEHRDLSLSAANIEKLDIDAGAGSLEVTGVKGLEDILVTAIIVVPEQSAAKAQEIVESSLTLHLEKSGQDAILKSDFDYHGRGDSPLVHLEVQMPAGLALEVEDSSGSIVIHDVAGNIEIDDSSGSIDMQRVGGAVRIEDGSGSINVSDVGADLSINDGSGSIKAVGIGGSVTVDDGSGSIKIRDVERDLIIVGDGSGSLDFSDIRGDVSSK